MSVLGGFAILAICAFFAWAVSPSPGHDHRPDTDFDIGE